MIGSIKSFIADASADLNAEEQMHGDPSLRIYVSLVRNGVMAKMELDGLCEYKDGEPITYSHYSTADYPAAP